MRQHAEQPIVCGDSRASFDLLTRLSLEDVDEALDLHDHVLALPSSFARTARIGVRGGEPDGSIEGVSVAGLYRCLWWILAWM
jgi:hypothetical protein